MTESTNAGLISHVTATNFLSFGSANSGLQMRSLNVLIGPNGSGKSNLIEAINFMRAAPDSDPNGGLRGVTRLGGGAAEWIWKGNKDGAASLQWVVRNPRNQTLLRHSVAFRAVSQSFALEDERVENAENLAGNADPYFYYKYQNGHPIVNTIEKGRRNLGRESIEADRSILAQRRDPDAYPELSWLAHSYEKIRIYREWAFGRSAVFRQPQKADMRNEALEEDFSNLGLFLNRLKTRFPAAKRLVLDGLRDLYDGLHDFDVLIEGGTVQVYFTEGEFVIPATRLSDGTLRYLCLLAILCDPEPPPLVCIEEPELGLHPDILPKVADLLRAAAERTQIVVTTHSDILVDAMSATPDAVVVCNKHDGQTEMQRLDPADLREWLEKYRLGQLWMKGEIGGTRW